MRCFRRQSALFLEHGSAGAGGLAGFPGARSYAQMLTTESPRADPEGAFVDGAGG